MRCNTYMLWQLRTDKANYSCSKCNMRNCRISNICRKQMLAHSGHYPVDYTRPYNEPIYITQSITPVNHNTCQSNSLFTVHPPVIDC